MHPHPILLSLPILAACGDKADSGDLPDPTRLCINEFMASNESTLPDEGGSYPDWIELYNSSPVDIPLAGVYLTDDLESPQKAELDPALVVPAGGYILLWADGDDTEGINHLPFSLKADGEELGLSWLDGQALYIIDSYSYEAQEPDVSAGRVPDGTANWIITDAPTPGSSNR